MSYLEAFRLGVTGGCLLASGLALWVATAVRRDAVSRARRVAMLTIERQAYPRIGSLEKYQHDHELRLEVLEEVELHRSRIRLAEGTQREEPETATTATAG